MDKQKVFIIGGTGFMGQALSAELLRRGHSVTVLARAGSEKKIQPGAAVVTGDPLNASTYSSYLTPQHTVVQLAGVSHPSPFKKDQFEKIDFVCGRESVAAARAARVQNFVYVSVAQPAPIMKSYIRARQRVEALLRESGLPHTILRPWYVLGPGRRWPLLIMPLYWIFENQSATRAAALRLGFVTREQMVTSLANAVEKPTIGGKIWEVPEIRKGGVNVQLLRE